jgi:Conjugal transfer protein
MQQLSDQDVQAAHVGVRPPKRRTSARRKVTVRLSEGVCGRLDVATDRPGVGKSMFVEAALEHFLNPAPSLEALVHERFDQMHARFDRLEHDMRMMAETVALHARYQLAVTPLVPQERQRDAILLGDERFKILAEQVDRRVRQQRPLMQETIDRLNSKGKRRYRYVIEGDHPPWRPVNVFDDGRKVYIEFSPSIGQGEMPPLFVIGQDGKPELVNYRIYKNVLIADRLFAAAELRLGGEKQQKVRIVRNDGRHS